MEKTASVAQLGLSIPGLWAVLQNDAKWYYKRKMGSKSGTNVDFLLTVLETEHTDGFVIFTQPYQCYDRYVKQNVWDG